MILVNKQETRDEHDNRFGRSEINSCW